MCITGVAWAGRAHVVLEVGITGLVVADAVGLVEPGKEKVVRIHNTLDLGEILASEVYLPEVEKREDLSIVEAAQDMAFDDRGDLLPF